MGQLNINQQCTGLSSNFARIGWKLPFRPASRCAFAANDRGQLCCHLYLPVPTFEYREKSWLSNTCLPSHSSRHAQQYHGGPKSPVPPTMGQISRGGDVYAQEVDVYAREVKPKKTHAYRGGPKTVVPHRY